MTGSMYWKNILINIIDTNFLRNLDLRTVIVHTWEEIASPEWLVFPSVPVWWIHWVWLRSHRAAFDGSGLHSEFEDLKLWNPLDCRLDCPPLWTNHLSGQARLWIRFLRNPIWLKTPLLCLRVNCGMSTNGSRLLRKADDTEFPQRDQLDEVDTKTDQWIAYLIK